MENIYNSIKSFIFIMLFFGGFFAPKLFIVLIILFILNITVIESVEEYYKDKKKSR